MGSGSRCLSCLCCPFKCVACGFCSCLCSILASLLATLGILALIIYLVFRPHMIAATVDSASLSAFALSPSSSTLHYNLTVAMTVRNPNGRVGLYYDAVEALALYQGQRFGYATLDPFFQARQASTQLYPVFAGQQVLDGDVADGFRSQQSGGAFKVPGPRARISCPLSLPTPGAAASAPAFKPIGSVGAQMGIDLS